MTVDEAEKSGILHLITLSEQLDVVVLLLDMECGSQVVQVVRLHHDDEVAVYGVLCVGVEITQHLNVGLVLQLRVVQDFSRQVRLVI